MESCLGRYLLNPIINIISAYSHFYPEEKNTIVKKKIKFHRGNVPSYILPVRYSKNLNLLLVLCCGDSSLDEKEIGPANLQVYDENCNYLYSLCICTSFPSFRIQVDSKNQLYVNCGNFICIYTWNHKHKTIRANGEIQYSGTDLRSFAVDKKDNLWIISEVIDNTFITMYDSFHKLMYKRSINFGVMFCPPMEVDENYIYYPRENESLIVKDRITTTECTPINLRIKNVDPFYGRIQLDSENKRIMTTFEDLSTMTNFINYYSFDENDEKFDLENKLLFQIELSQNIDTHTICISSDRRRIHAIESVDDEDTIDYFLVTYFS